MTTGGILRLELAAICRSDDWRVSENLVRDAPHFQTKGLENFTEQECAALIESYAAIDSPLAQEIVAWLRGEYVFDPACLTN